ncbi:PTS glucose transporter subunit IIA [Paenibacillus sp. MBLB2552]|uniref:PTS glucose transporter subunit IIA n=1 Tax=Paenibacillus mellifer TaxID=2937794 RepID=A0A9X2BTZ6_9BACL|nr:PTS glucose transporter subunit IIA [Paenibacillus mellifer]MCK8488466.1 PTS glucose transporter subunit IIA [Paenibacillus mellifer]
MFSKWRKKNTESKVLEILSPLTGEAVALTQVPDEAFAGGHMGPGLAVEPSEGRLVAPFDGQIVHVIKSNHAVMMEHPSGLQFLFHLGINTVSLKGEGFIAHVAVGDKVKTGQLLIEFDLASIREAGYPVISPVIVTNAGEVTNSVETLTGPVTAGGNVILKAVLQ